MTLRSTCGIVLKIADQGESDKLVTLYSSDLGRVTGIAKGAKKSKQRFVNKLEEFSHLRVMYRPPRRTDGLLFLSEAELLCAHLPLRQDYRRYIAAMYIAELIARFTRDNDHDLRLYALLKWAISSLHDNHAPQKIAALFHLQLLTLTGYRPELTQCGNCRQPVGPGRNYMFLPGKGTLLCNVCDLRQGQNPSQLSVQTLKFLASAQITALDRLNRLNLTAQTSFEALDALHRYTTHLLQHDIHSWQIMRSFGFSRIHKKY